MNLETRILILEKQVETLAELIMKYFSEDRDTYADKDGDEESQTQ